MIDAALESVRPAASARGIDLAPVIEGPAVITGDAERLQQVLWNLLSNAIKFTPEAGRIEVRLRPGPDSATVEVTDSGKGIDPEFLPHVFERFRQADSSPTRRHGGLGLGLAIVKHLVELHGGSVQAESAGAGHGATFTVTLPAGVHGGAQDHERSPSILGEVDLTGVEVLLVDDDPGTLAAVGRILTEYHAYAERERQEHRVPV